MTRVCWNGYFDRALSRLISLTARCADTNMAIQTDRTRIVHRYSSKNLCLRLEGGTRDAKGWQIL